MKIHRHRLRVSEQKRGTQEQEDCRQQDGPEWVDMFQRIEGDSSEAVRSIIPQAMGNKAVCRFMQRDGKEDGENPGRGRVQDRIELHGRPVCSRLGRVTSKMGVRNRLRSRA